jgi:hypothetical protein
MWRMFELLNKQLILQQYFYFPLATPTFGEDSPGAAKGFAAVKHPGGMSWVGNGTRRRTVR